MARSHAWALNLSDLPHYSYPHSIHFLKVQGSPYKLPHRTSSVQHQFGQLAACSRNNPPARNLRSCPNSPGPTAIPLNKLPALKSTLLRVKVSLAPGTACRRLQAAATRDGLKPSHATCKPARITRTAPLACVRQDSAWLSTCSPAIS